MAKVSYEDCSGQSSSVDKSSTFEVCSNNPNSFQYDPSLWRVEEIGMCSEVKPTCNKYIVTREKGNIDRSTILYEDCESGQGRTAVLKGKKGSSLEICSQKDPFWARNSFISEGKISIKKIGICGDSDSDVKEDPPIPANRYYELVPCDNTPISVYTKRLPLLDNERVSISNPQDANVSFDVSWTYNGQTTDTDNPGLLAASVFSKNTSGCTDSEIDEPDDNGLGQNPYQIEIRTNLNSGVASLNINGSQRGISTSNTLNITNANPVSANDFRNVPTFSYSVGDVVEVTESSGEVRNYTVSDVEERSFKGGTQSVKKLSRGESLQYIGQAVNFNVIYTIYLESSGDVIDTDRPDQPVTGGPDGNTTGVRTGPGNTSTNDEVFGPR